jgi:hypothetical protein
MKQMNEAKEPVRNLRSTCDPFAGLALLTAYCHAIRGLAYCSIHVVMRTRFLPRSPGIYICHSLTGGATRCVC